MSFAKIDPSYAAVSQTSSESDEESDELEIIPTSPLCHQANSILAGDVRQVSLSVGTSRFVLKTLGVGLAVIGKVPFIPISVLASASILGFQSKALGIPLALGNTVSFAIVISWSMLKMIDSLFEEIILDQTTSKRNSCCFKVAITIFSIAVGVISQFAVAYLSYVYNNQDILMPILMLLSDSWIPSYSIKTSIEKMWNRLSEKNEHSDKIKQSTLKLMKKIDASLQTKPSILNFWRKLDFDDRENLMKNYLSLCAQRASEIAVPTSTPCCNQAATFGILGVGWILAAVRIFSLAYFGFQGGLLITSSLAGGISIGILVGLANAYINGAFIPNLTYRVCVATKDFFLCKQTQTLSEQIAPKTSFGFKAIAILFPLFSWGPSYQTAHDYFSGWFMYFLGISTSIATTLFTATATLDLVDKLINRLIIWKGSLDNQEAITYKNRMAKLYTLIQNASPKDLENLSNGLPEHLRTSILSGASVSIPLTATRTP